MWLEWIFVLLWIIVFYFWPVIVSSYFKYRTNITWKTFSICLFFGYFVYILYWLIFGYLFVFIYFSYLSILNCYESMLEDYYGKFCGPVYNYFNDYSKFVVFALMMIATYISMKYFIRKYGERLKHKSKSGAVGTI